MPRHQFKKGDPRINRDGRPNGSKNRFTRDVKEALLNAFEKLGGEKWLISLAKKDRKAFSSLLGKTIPAELTGKDGGPIEVQLRKATDGLSNLDDAEFAQLIALLTKCGLIQSNDSAPQE